MPDCECLPRCPLFHDQMAAMPSTAEMIKGQCRSGPRADNAHCARHISFAVLGSAEVPSDIFPSNVPCGQALQVGR